MQTLFYQLERIFRMNSIPVRCIDAADHITFFSRGYEAGQDPLMNDAAVLDIVKSRLSASKKPIVEFEDDIFIYGALNDTTGCQIILGPVSLSTVDNMQISQYARVHGVEPQGLHIKQSNLIRFSSALALIHHMRFEDMLTETDLVLSNNALFDSELKKESYQGYIMDNVENDIKRLNYADELQFKKRISEGIVYDDGYNAEVDVAHTEEKIGRLAENTFKQYEYMTCSTICLASRAAIDGGLAPLTSYAISDVYFQRLEKCKSIVEMMNLQKEVQYDYSLKVRESKEKRSKVSFVEKCKNYITNHLNKPFSLEDIAAEIGVNKTYLSRRFSQEEGVGIMKYTRRRRVEAAANMLKYSEESLSTIANYLCFPSQSHFGAVFKEEMGVSPHKYRKREQLIDVSSKNYLK